MSRAFKILIIFQIFQLIGCSGYRFRSNNNPFREYGIKTIAVPMFLNRSIYPNLNTKLTREVRRMLSQYNDLKVVFGDGKNADAVLVGVLRSSDHHKDAYKVNSTKFTTGLLKDSIGGRNQFYVPISTLYQFSVQMVLIKRPTKEELDLVKSQVGPFIKNHPKFIFNESLNITKTFSHIVADNNNQDPDNGGVVNSTKNRAIFERSLEEVAEDFSTTFREVIIYAF